MPSRKLAPEMPIANGGGISRWVQDTISQTALEFVPPAPSRSVGLQSADVVRPGREGCPGATGNHCRGKDDLGRIPTLPRLVTLAPAVDLPARCRQATGVELSPIDLRPGEGAGDGHWRLHCERILGSELGLVIQPPAERRAVRVDGTSMVKTGRHSGEGPGVQLPGGRGGEFDLSVDVRPDYGDLLGAGGGPQSPHCLQLTIYVGGGGALNDLTETGNAHELYRDPGLWNAKGVQ